jgi:hypothetical protein
MLANVLFVHPIRLPPGGRLWMFLPLALCIAMVYRATRARNVRELPRPTIVNFIQIVIGMIVIAIAFYVFHAIVLWWS